MTAGELHLQRVVCWCVREEILNKEVVIEYGLSIHRT